MNINQQFPSKWIKTDDIKGRSVAVRIRAVTIEPVTDDDTKPVLWFQGKEKGLVLNKTNAQLIAHYYGPETDAWAGKEVVLRSEPVSFQGRIVDSIRISVPEPPPTDPSKDLDDDIPF